LLELVDANPQDVPFEGAELLGRPIAGDGADPLVEPGGLLDDGLGETARERVDFALLARPERLSGEVPLVEEEERRPAPCLTRERHALR